MERVAEAVVDELVRGGIRTVYGLPGGELVELLDALRRNELRFVLTQREASAGFMASTTAHLTWRPSVCLTTLGPGAANAVAGVAHAFLDRAPVLFITAQMAENLRPLHTHQYLDLDSLLSSITKASFRINPGNVRSAVREALAIAQSGRPGPVHLELSNDQAALPAAASQKEIGNAERSNAESQKRAQELEKALDVLSTARRPIVVAGLGLEPQAPYEALKCLIEAGDIPTIVTPKAKGALSADHPLFAGTFGLTRDDPVEQVLAETDCVLAVGLDVVELVKPWVHPEPMIWVAPWENRDPTLPAEAELIGSMEFYLEQLSSASFSTESGWGKRRLEAHHKEFENISLCAPKKGMLRPQDVLNVLSETLPRETILSTDVGSHKILYSLEWPTYLPNRFLVSNGLSSMGFALPAAAAAALHYPDAPVVATVGDAGLLMQLGDLNLLKELKLPVLVVVFKDDALDLIRSHQNRAGKATFGTEFDAPDFVSIAEGFGIAAERISEVGSLLQATNGWLHKREDPFLLEILIDPASYPTTQS